MRALLAAAVLVLAGCAPSGPCAPRTGTYVAHYEQRPGGTCGTLTDVVVMGGDDIGPGCTGTSTPSADNCVVDFSEMCTDSAGTFHFTGESMWSTDGNSGEAVVTYSESCVSTYDITFRRP